MYVLSFSIGLLLLFFGGMNYGNGPNPPPELFGVYLMPSLGVLVVAGTAIAIGLQWLIRHQVDHFSLIIYALAGLISLHYLHLSKNSAYTNDMGGHLAYALYISTHWLTPNHYYGGQSHHPAMYYYAAAFFIHIARTLHTIEPVTAVRFVSWLSYLAFNAFSLLTLRRAGLSGMGYRACALLLLLWPAGIHMACTINNEIMYYAWYAAAFYYAVLWYQEGRERHIQTAWILAGIALVARSNAAILFILLLLYMAVAWARGRFRLRSLLSAWWFATFSILVLCALLNVDRILPELFTTGAWSSHMSNPSGPLIADKVGHFLFVGYDYALSHPFNDWTMKQSFWDFLLKTSLFGEYMWPWGDMAVGMDALLYALVLYMVIPWFTATGKICKGVWVFVAGALIPLLLMMAFTWWKYTQTCQDFRYIYPSLVAFIALFGRSQQLYASRGYPVLSALGPVLAWGLAICGVIFFWYSVR